MNTTNKTITHTLAMLLVVVLLASSVWAGTLSGCSNAKTREDPEGKDLITCSNTAGPNSDEPSQIGFYVQKGTRPGLYDGLVFEKTEGMSGKIVKGTTEIASAGPFSAYQTGQDEPMTSSYTPPVTYKFANYEKEGSVYVNQKNEVFRRTAEGEWKSKSGGVLKDSAVETAISELNRPKGIFTKETYESIEGNMDGSVLRHLDDNSLWNHNKAQRLGINPVNSYNLAKTDPAKLEKIVEIAQTAKDAGLSKNEYSELVVNDGFDLVDAKISAIKAGVPQSYRNKIKKAEDLNSLTDVWSKAKDAGLPKTELEQIISNLGVADNFDVKKASENIAESIEYRKELKAEADSIGLEIRSGWANDKLAEELGKKYGELSKKYGVDIKIEDLNEYKKRLKNLKEAYAAEKKGVHPDDIKEALKADDAGEALETAVKRRAELDKKAEDVGLTGMEKKSAKDYEAELVKKYNELAKAVDSSWKDKTELDDFEENDVKIITAAAKAKEFKIEVTKKNVDTVIEQIETLEKLKQEQYISYDDIINTKGDREKIGALKKESDRRKKAVNDVLKRYKNPAVKERKELEIIQMTRQEDAAVFDQTIKLENALTDSRFKGFSAFDEVFSVCEGGKCSNLDAYIGQDGKLVFDMDVTDASGKSQYVSVEAGGWECVSCTSCGSAGQLPCTSEDMFGEGAKWKNTETGEELVSEGVEACGKEEGCVNKPKGFTTEGNRYWAPNTWADWIFGGPAVMGMKSFSRLVVDWKDVFGDWYTKWSAFLDRYFNLERLVTESFCEAVHSVEARGVGISPYGSGTPTAMIQAQKWKVEPCVDLGGDARRTCLRNQSLTDDRDFYWVYRITGKLIPKDCGMKFNIYLEGDDEKKKLYETVREAKRGSYPFDLSGANAIVTSKKDLPEYDKVCIRFESDISDCFMHASPFDTQAKLCNKVYESGEKYVVQTARVDVDTGQVIEEGEEGPTTSSNREGLTV